ncbi:hypothetical protein EV424DRAFT_1583715 [Suillus variegatus]|nr:hypothetical protein EV424DRAFT_1583715 [Suillus variegatus]
MSSCFTFDNDLIDGLMLEKRGIVFENSRAVELKICPQCKSSLAHEKIPSLALANGLFRGSLPDQFQDLTWVEEKICAIYSITAHVTRLFQSSDPSQPKVFHGNTCAHDTNVMSTASVLPRTPADINGFLSVVFIGPQPFDPKRMGTLFRVRKHKIWSFLVWLKSHNCLYADIELDLAVLDQYPADGTLPGLHERVVEDRELDARRVFSSETAGFATHPAELLEAPSTPASDVAIDEPITLLEKMGVSDPECDKR